MNFYTVMKHPTQNIQTKRFAPQKKFAPHTPENTSPPIYFKKRAHTRFQTF